MSVVDVWRRRAGRFGGGIRLGGIICQVALLWLGAAGGVAAQGSDLPDNLPPGLSLPPEVERALQERRGEERRAQPTNEVIRARRAAANLVPADPSAVEALFSERAESDLEQFGYDFFESVDSVVVRQQGGVQDSYVMGPGDRIVVDLRGQENATYRLSVDREGRVFINHLKPIVVAGRSFGAFRRELEKRVEQAYIATDVFVSLENIRQASVTVSGEVGVPGVHVVSGLSSVLDALVLAGGVKKTGSLRNIVIRRNGKVRPVDLYAVFSHRGPDLNLTLRDGDRIVVPPLGKTVAVAGDVQRPGIFELRNGNTGIEAEVLVELAGGVNARGAYRLNVLRIRDDGFRQLSELGSLATGRIGDSEILFINPAVDRSVGQVMLIGHVRAGGKFALKQERTLKGLLSSRDVFDRSPYLLFGLISRRNPDSLLREVIPFSPLQVVSGEQDVKLADDDIVRVFGVNEVRALGLAVDQSEEEERRSRERKLYRQSPRLREFQNAPPPGTGVPDREPDIRGGGEGLQAQSAPGAGTPGDDQVARALSGSLAMAEGEDDLLAAVRNERMGTDRPAALGQVQGREARSETGRAGTDAARTVTNYAGASNVLAQQLLVDPTLVSRLLANYRVNMLGAVRVPGYYFVLPDTSLADLVGAAGGTDYRVDLGAVEVTATNIDNASGQSRTIRRVISLTETDMNVVRVQPLDTVRFRRVFSDLDEGTVTVRGQVRSEGAYDILRGETLSSVIQRAGGLTDSAYPYGAVFIRRSAARNEQRANQRTATEIETQLLTVRKNVEVSPTQAALVRDVMERLRDAEGLGRISVEADPNVLAARPALDVVLEPGDVIYFPRRPTTVSVSGMVLNPGSYQFRPGQDASDYVQMAGGFSQFADDGRMFVIFPDGTSRPLDGSFWSTKSFEIPPGSTIVVPRDLTPFDLGQFAVDFTQVLSQLAISAASVSVVGN